MYLVTQGEYEKVIGVNPSAFTEKQMDASTFNPPMSPDDWQVKERLKDRGRCVGKDTSRYPVETVVWDEATEFCRRLSATPAERAAGRVYRLPTEAQWEYACRAGTTTRWYSGDDEAGLVDVAWFDNNSGAQTHPVGQKAPNSWRLYDMHGNVSQWCQDWYEKDYYADSVTDGPVGPSSGGYRVPRGGSFAMQAGFCHSASRNISHPTGVTPIGDSESPCSSDRTRATARKAPHPQSPRVNHDTSGQRCSTEKTSADGQSTAATVSNGTSRTGSSRRNRLQVIRHASFFPTKSMPTLRCDSSFKSATTVLTGELRSVRSKAKNVR